MPKDEVVVLTYLSDSSFPLLAKGDSLPAEAIGASMPAALAFSESGISSLLRFVF